MLENINSAVEIKKLNAQQRKLLCADIREMLIQTVAERGGHLASNLGVVELSVALHTVFDTPEDKLIFDVGHQAYVHKILTGRKEQFTTLRTKGGISGFPRNKESVHDAFDTGHAGTAISVALGMARSRDLQKQKHSVVAIVGDGALTNGMCYEALDDAGNTETPLIVILNDNEMSIAPNVGAMSGHLTKMRQSNAYRRAKFVVRGALNRIPAVGKPLANGVEHIKDAIKSFFVNDHFFEALGFEYQGPIDGHDTELLIDVLNSAKKAEGPVLLHVVTQKGKGYSLAEKHPENFHGVAPFLVEDGQLVQNADRTNAEVMVQELIRLAKQNSKIVAITAAMPGGTGLAEYAALFGDRYFDVGIAEEHAVTMAASMAMSGLRPYFAVYATFLQRGYDQILHDVCLNNLPVTFLVDRTGLNGEDGATHQGIYAFSFLRHMPNLTVVAPRDAHDLERIMQMSAQTQGPLAICYAKKANDLGHSMWSDQPFVLGKWETLTQGSDVMVLAVGNMVKYALRSSIDLAGRGISCGVVDARFIKPLDTELLDQLVRQNVALVTLEDNAVEGGFGSAVLEYLTERGADNKVLNLGVPDCFIEHATRYQQLEECGLTPEHILKSISDFFEKVQRRPKE